MGQTPDVVDLVIVLGVVTVDQVLKAFTEQLSFTTRFFSLHTVENTGAAFGFFQGYNAVFVFVTVAVLGLVWLSRDTLPGRSASAIFAGGLSNLVDRVVRGHVVDFLDVGWWPVFNVADMAVSLGVAYAVVWLYVED